MKAEEMYCPKCGGRMLLLPDSEYQLYEVYAIQYVCPNCLHLEEVRCLTLRKERWK